jgi:ssDNA-binding Zn-finger/Zn-ribbon topoisomerase 1
MDRDQSHAEELILVAPMEKCPSCRHNLWIVQWRQRYVQTLDKCLHLVMKDKRCPSAGCPRPELRYRSPEEGRLALKRHDFGLDVVLFAGEKHLRESVSLPRVHRLLREEHQVPICERSVGNLVDDYVALCECVAGDTDRLRARLKQQGAIVLSVDGVQHDDHSPVLYVQRDVLSGEVLYAERRLARATEDLVPMLERTRNLARDLEVPILGIVSDKERGLVPAIAKVFPQTPHQYCQQHYLKNVAEAWEEDEARLREAAHEVVLGVRTVQRKMERQLAATGVADHTDGRPVPASLGAGGRSATDDAAATIHSSPSAPAASSDLPARRPEGGRRASSAQELQVAAALAQAATTVGAVCGRPIVDPEGLKRVRRLEAVRDVARQAARKKGVPRAAGR